LVLLGTISMKIFWSWQSDHDPDISHRFVKDALADAIKALKSESVLEEPSEAERRTQLHLDHDTKGKTGWVDITQSIFEKIESAAVFVADVTPVVVAASKLDGEGKEIGKRPIMNPNVAIELGYALKALDWSKIVPVMNTAYGSVERMPFDIDRTRRWAIQYELKEGATKAEIKEARGKLAKVFAEALKGFLPAAAQPEPFKETAPQIPPGLFFKDGDALAIRRNPIEKTQADHRMSSRTYAYLRLIPTKRSPIPLAEQLLSATVGRHGAFAGLPGNIIQPNDYGVAFSLLMPASFEIEGLTQYFRNGEIWGVNAYITQPGHGETWISALPLENTFITSLELYCMYMEMHSKVKPPITVEAGVVGVKNMRLVYNGLHDAMGKMYEPDVVHRAIMPDFSKPTRDAFLGAFLEKVHGNTGVQRPPGLFNRW
jgi:hypothetical protein